MGRKMIIQVQDIEYYLAHPGQTLQDWQIECPVRILMVGGAFMVY
jgi:hypothetical protein